MLDRFEGEVRRQFRGANRPYLKCLQISKGWAKLPPAIKQHLVDPFTGSKTAGLDRLKEHWWFDEAGIPFDAEFVSPLHEGAGQVPSVSYFLAWMKMEELEGRSMNLSPRSPAAALAKLLMPRHSKTTTSSSSAAWPEAPAAAVGTS